MRISLIKIATNFGANIHVEKSFVVIECVSAMIFANVETLKIILNQQYPNIHVKKIQATENDRTI